METVTDHHCKGYIGIAADVAPRGRKADPGDAGAIARRRAAVLRPVPALLMKWLWTALLVICLAPLQAHAVNNGDRIINIAELKTQESAPLVSTVTVTVTTDTGFAAPKIELLKYAPTASAAERVTVDATWYRTAGDAGAAFEKMAELYPLGESSAIALPSLVPLVVTDLFHQCEPVFIRVTDARQNLDPTVRDTVLATLTDPTTHLTQVLRLTETGNNTGVFTGYIVSTGAICRSNPPAASYNGFLPLAEASKISASFTDVSTGQEVSRDAVVDPLGIIFNSLNGKPIDGVTITLLDTSTGNPALVYGDDGVSIFPATIVTGGTPTDTSGRAYAYPPGGFRFPFVKPGSYRFQVATPPGFALPSAVSDASLQALPGGPFALGIGSRLESFTINPGPALHVDIPADPLPATLWLQKTAGKGIVSIGDFLPYQLDLQNNNTDATAYGVTITDTMPAGFRYRKGSTHVQGVVAADPVVSGDGRTLTFTLADLAPKTATSLRYVAEVAAGAQLGSAVNSATAHSFATTSNTARATVQVQSDFLNTTSLLMGRVARGPCDLDWDDGVEGVRIYLEDGTFVNTDKQGMFHFEGVKPGSHVVQLDLDSLPEGFEVYQCQENSRFAGRSFSQFVDAQGGTLWRADFRAGSPGDAALYAKRKMERAAAEKLAAEKIAKEAEAIRQEEARKAAAAAKKAADAKEEEELENSVVDDWAPTVKAAGTAVTEAEPAPADDWAEPAPAAAAAAAPAPAQASKTGRPEKSEEAAQLAASIDLLSALDRKEVVYSSRIEVARTPLTKGVVEVVLPAGMTYRPGSAVWRGSSLADPKVSGKTLSFNLATLASGHKSTLSFGAVFAADAPLGEYIAHARLGYAAGAEAAGYTSYAENVLIRIPDEDRKALPAMTVFPQFDVLSNELTAEDKTMLNDTALMIESFKKRGLFSVRQVLLVGHTDNTPIARRSRRVYRDNMELSVARAQRVAHYLRERLGLTPAEISASGRGESAPVASNRSAEGRASNRRVEVLILTEQVARRSTAAVAGKVSGTGQLQAGTTAPGPAGGPQSEPVSLRPAGKQQASRRESAPLIPILFSYELPVTFKSAAAPVTAAAWVAPAAVALPGTSRQAQGAANPLWLFLDAEATAQSPAAPAKAAPAEAEEPHLEKVGIISPADGSSLIDAISAVRVVLDSKLTPRLLLDGQEIPADRIGFTMRDNKVEKSLYSYIGVNFGDPGVHTLTLQGTDSFGIARFEASAKVTRTGAIAVIRFLGGEGNVADGKTPVRLKLQLIDAAGVVIPAAAELQILEGTLRPLKKEKRETSAPEAGQEKGDKIQVDSEGYALFQPVNASGLYRTVLGAGAGRAKVEAETYVQPNLRKNWILVGMGEGTAGYNALAGHMENLHDSGADENLYENGRIAFYGKGTVQGKWLLTMAYDSAKNSNQAGSSSLFQTINPETNYTLYGDASQQQYDAASQRKLYLKIERDQFYALFGDYDTGLTVSELSRYSRRLNGVKAEWQGKNFEANVFGSDTAQVYARDEMLGDGTSGLYHLSRKSIVLNSDKITIEVRDRFRSEIILSSVVLNRYTDYSVDYDAGTIFFKEPIQSKDLNFNPIYIVAEYETAGAGSGAITAGGRVGARLLDNKLKTGVTYIHEGQVSGAGNSYGVDAALKIGEGTTLKAEAAQTDTNFGGLTRTGNAFLGELQQQSKLFQGKLYFREQAAGFGLGQQNGSEIGTRKAGSDASYKLTDSVTLSGLAYREDNLTTSAVRDMVEAKAIYTTGPYSAHLGGRYASDLLGDGSRQTSEQLTMGGSWLTLDKRLTLRADHDQSIGGNSNVDFPTRTSFGADYKLTEKVTLMAAQEFTSGAGADTNTTRVGFRSTPWQGGAFNTSMDRNLSENGDRLLALFGLKQSWKINDNLSVDGSVDRSQTVSNSQNYSFNVNVPPASGSTEDFTAVSLGTTYTEKKWNWNNRVEYRTSTSENKWGVVSAFVGEPMEGWGWSSRLQIFDTQSSVNGSAVNDDLRLGLVYRPLHSRWILLDRLDLLYSKQDGTIGTTSSMESRRAVNNLSANFKPGKKSEISLLYGAKYVLDTIDDLHYSGFTDLIAVEGRYDLTSQWDLGFRGSVLHSWMSGQYSSSAGPSLGYNVIQNAWISLGYNFIGFTDKDFSQANYTAQGPYVKFRFKFDQNSVKDAATWINRQ